MSRGANTDEGLREKVARAAARERALQAVLDVRERELLALKGPCSTIECVLHYAHSGPCDCRAASRGAQFVDAVPAVRPLDDGSRDGAQVLRDAADEAEAIHEIAWTQSGDVTPEQMRRYLDSGLQGVVDATDEPCLILVGQWLRVRADRLAPDARP